ncbi:MAG: YicC family protein [Verrucomicrobia bacterium]|nr:YicC family protein [Verrucomicrobiota bacterium]
MRSMTGFGSGEASSSRWKISVEMASVNRKQAELVIHLPRSLASLEPRIRSGLLEVFSRGRITVQVAVEPLAGGRGVLQVDETLAAEYFQAFHLLQGVCNGQMTPFQAADLLRAPGVFTVREDTVSLQDVESVLDDALGGAFRRLLEMQNLEGGRLRADLRNRLETLRVRTGEIAEQSPRVKERYRLQLRKRLLDSGLDVPLDDERLLREIAIFAERCDLSEELTRLHSHFDQFDRYFDDPEPMGRALDFLCQEVNRELNTIGSKANDASIAHAVVEAKTELEKIREQVQNVQ